MMMILSLVMVKDGSDSPIVPGPRSVIVEIIMGWEVMVSRTCNILIVKSNSYRFFCFSTCFNYKMTENIHYSLGCV